MSAKWWTEDRRGKLTGHGIRWGNKWAHITRLTDDGPGAVGIQPICYGIQSVMLVNSGMDLEDKEECEAWKRRTVEIPLGSLLEDVILPKRLDRICPKCRAAYQKHIDKMARP